MLMINERDRETKEVDLDRIPSPVFVKYAEDLLVEGEPLGSQEPPLDADDAIRLGRDGRIDGGTAPARMARQACATSFRAVLERLCTVGPRSPRPISPQLWIRLASLPAGDHATTTVSLDLQDLVLTSDMDWSRWRELVDLENERALTPGEQREYEELLRVVARLDAQEEALAAPAVDALIRRHDRVLASLECLTRAVQAAAERSQ